MKKKFLLIYIILICILLIGCTLKNENNSNNNTNIEAQNPSPSSTPTPTSTSTPTPTTSPAPTTTPTTSQNPTENTLYEFSTTIKSKSSNRLNNISITCNTLNETIVEPNKEFSFCNTIGKATSEKGYKKADVIINKKVEQALGGGNCQVSTTLYNAVLGIPDIKVTERHPHGKKVNYVPEGKDAAISYGSKDLKFINNTSTPLKIYANTDNNKVYIRIVSLT